MTPLALALNSALLHLLWQGAVVAFLLWMTLAALRNRSAQTRYVISCAALGILALAPIVTMCLVYQRPADFPMSFPSAGTVFAIAAFTTPISSPTNWLALAQSWLLPAWTCGVALLSMRLLWGYRKVSTMKQSGDLAEQAVLAMVGKVSERLGITTPVRVLMSSFADGCPCVIGWLKPVVLIPGATLLGLTSEQLEAVLAHELAHIRRYDYLVNIVQMLIETLFFYHPAVWWISTRIRQERELCCDDIAVRCCGDAVGYARALTTLERMRVLSPGFALGAKDGPLMYRIQRLLGAVPRENGPSRLPGIVAILLAATCLSTDMNPVKAQAPLKNPNPPAPPSAPAFVVPPQKPPTRAPAQIAQVLQPPAVVNAPASAPALGGPVTVEVTIDQNGLASDARVISGPQSQRRSALLTALSMHFPPEDASTSRWVDIPAIPPAPASRSFLRAVPTQAGAANTIRNLKDRIEGAIAQQAVASTEDKAKLQETIDSWRRNIQEMQPIAAGQDPLVGSTLAEVDISNLTDAAREQLIAQLPIHMYDVLTDDSMRAAVRVAHEALPNATIYFGETETGQAGLVVIAPPPPRPTLVMMR
ncbi:MAG TPA: M56 family metallopeptidase [Bryobacteraceae bacterium]|jgi:beta-lactamase regulating signal transducer with metallopeptidase domain